MAGGESISVVLYVAASSISSDLANSRHLEISGMEAAVQQPAVLDGQWGA